MSMTDERWHSVEEAALHLGVARDTVYRWIDQKRLPAHRVGRLWKFKLSEIDNWVRGGGAATESQVISSAKRTRR
jgi:excisionase family DNA binding protein